MPEYTTYKDVSEADLINTLRNSAIERQAEGVIRITLVENEPSSEPTCVFHLIMGESVSDPE